MPDPKCPSAEELLRHGAWLRRLAERLTSDGSAPDLVQETWISALLHRPQAPGPWLRRVLHNKVTSAARERARRRAREAAHARPEALPSALELAARAETTRLLVEAVLRLKPVQRDVILLRYFDQLPPARIGEHLGMCSATVRSHLMRGLACLRRDLDATSGGDRASWVGALALFQAKSARTATSLTGLLMTTTQKLAAVLALALIGTGVWWWRSGTHRLGSPPPLEGRDTTGLATLPAESPPPEAPPHRDATMERLPVVASTASAGTVRVQVLHADTGAAVPNTTVLHVASGFAWGRLDAQAQEAYSLATESFLRKFGEQTESDDQGMVEIPAYAAHAAIVGRRGDLYGIGVDRREGGLWTLALAPHHQLVVEVVDASGGAVEGIRVVKESVPSAFEPFHKVLPLGTTDANGRVRHVFKAPAAGGLPQRVSVYASLPGAKAGAFEMDPGAPPQQPVRITLPAYGSVSLLILDPAEHPLDPRGLADPNVELALAGSSPNAAGLFGSVRHRAPIDASGRARFTHVPLGGKWTISAPALLRTELQIEGPSEGNLEVLVQHRMHPDHPMLAGRLLDDQARPMPNARFSILCRSENDFLSMVGGVTTEQGAFAAYLPENVMGKQPEEVTFGMDWEGTAPTRAARVSLWGPLVGVTRVGDVVMPSRE